MKFIWKFFKKLPLKYKWRYIIPRQQPEYQLKERDHSIKTHHHPKNPKKPAKHFINDILDFMAKGPRPEKLP